MESRKQVTFLERDSDCQGLQQSCMKRTLGHNFPKTHASNALMFPLTKKVAEPKELKGRGYQVLLQQPSLTPQHPGLKTGQKRYLYSIANIYSTDHMHRLMQKQYLSMLQHRTQLGYITPHECQKYTDYLTKQSHKETRKQSNSRSSTAQSLSKQSPTLQAGRPHFLPVIGDSSWRLPSRAPNKVNLKAKRAQVQVNRSDQIQKIKSQQGKQESTKETKK
ncbi:protein FAM216A isoform X3 [Stegostoma tigrinum]|uniref:protein FAM216A isoform X3 n=1 Tax=Stegostoma tigrinum TaxID=3053191 RepID=UPI00202B7B72|nr:protein FAM216A isoform X3 [Stegostoma tigrinum]